MKFFKSLVQKFAGKPVDWDDLEEMLIRSDLGVPMSLRILEALQKRALSQNITAQDVAEVARLQARSFANAWGAEAIGVQALPLHLRRARLTGVSLQANGSVCRGLLRERYATVGLGDEEETL